MQLLQRLALDSVKSLQSSAASSKHEFTHHRHECTVFRRLHARPVLRAVRWTGQSGQLARVHMQYEDPPHRCDLLHRLSLKSTVAFCFGEAEVTSADSVNIGTTRWDNTPACGRGLTELLSRHHN